MYKAGIIGCSWIAIDAPDSHLKAYEENPNTTPIALCDINGRADFTNCIDPDFDVDIVSVCTPQETHAEIVCMVAPFVKAIWCEKPIATTIEDAERMIEVCEGFGTTLVINHQRNYTNPKFRFSRGMLHTGTHVFALIDHLFKVPVDVEYIDTDDRIFELDCLHTKERMLPNVLKFIVDKLDKGETYLDFNALTALRRCLCTQ